MGWNGREIEPGEEDLPEGWDATNDPDAVLRTIMQLAREADQTPKTPPALLRAIQDEIRRDLTSEGYLNPIQSLDGEKSRKSFMEWVRLTLLGNKPAGQMVRFAFIGGFAFAVGMHFNQPAINTTTGGEDRQITTALLADSGPNAKKEWSFNGGSPREAAALPEMKAVSAEAISDVFDPALNGTELAAAAPPAARAINPGVSTSIDKSWKDTADHVMWQFPSGNSVNRPSVGQYTTSAEQAQPEFASQLFNQVQILRVDPLISGNQYDLEELRQLQAMATNFIRRQNGQQMVATAAAERFDVAENLLKGDKFSEAVEEFIRVTEIAPNSPMAFTAQLQAGLISSQRLRDYDYAVECFNHCLNDYPTLNVSPSGRKFLESQVEVLTQGRADNWESFREWQAAKQSTDPIEAINKYISILRTTQSGRLAVDAAEELRDILVQRRDGNVFDTRIVREVLSARVESTPPGPDTARIQFCLAEIVAHRDQLLDQATEQYNRARELGPDARTARDIQTGMNFLTSRTQMIHVRVGDVTPTPP